MGVAIFGLVMFCAGGLIAIIINAITDESRRNLKKKLYLAQDALWDIDGAILKHVGQLDIVGQAMSDEIAESLTEFKRGMIK